MTAYTFMVTCDVERESGMHAGRDEISEIISERIIDAIDGETIDGVGPRSDSTYSTSATEVNTLEKKSERDAWMEYDEAVIAEYPGDAAILKELREARRISKELAQEVGRLEKFIQRMRAAADEKMPPTRIYQLDSLREAPPVYLRDGRYDAITFVPKAGSDRLEDGIVITMDEKGSLEIRSNSFGRMAVLPQSGNVVQIALIDR